MGTLSLRCKSDVGPSDTERMPNAELAGIIQELEELASEPNCDAYLLYLYHLSYQN